jgi:CRISPR-associated protein Cas6
MEQVAPMVDVVFDVAGTTLPAEHAYVLWRATLPWLGWLEEEAGAGIHRLRTAPTGYGVALLARRAKLALRVPLRRVGDTLALADKTLDVGGSRLPSARSSPAAAAVGDTPCAAGRCGQGMKRRFRTKLRHRWTRGVACQFITGRRRTVAAGAREIAGFSVVLHSLTAEGSLRLQSEGMGGDRVLGCGIFIPYKSIAAVV